MYVNTKSFPSVSGKFSHQQMSKGGRKLGRNTLNSLHIVIL
jgi:hypothetical protein